MESERRRVLQRSRKPLSDCTNSSHSSSSSVHLKPTKPNPSSSSASNKPSSKRTSATNVSANLVHASNPSVPPPPPPPVSTPLKTSSLHGTIDLEASEPISVVYSRRRSSNKRKDKGKAVDFPVSSTPILKTSNSWERNDEVEGVNLPKAKALTVPCRKKQRGVTSEHDKDPLLQDFIEKQKAYFKMIDEFKLPEEEVESIDQLD